MGSDTMVVAHPVLGLRRDSDSTVSAIPGSMNFPVILLLVVSKN